MNSASKLRIYFLLQTAAEQVRKQADKELIHGAGVSAAQAAVLAIIRRQTAISQKEVSDLLHQNESAMTTMVARLEAAELITKTRSPLDARAWELRLTPNGEHTYRNAERIFRQINADLSESLGATRLSRLGADLNTVIDRFTPTGSENS